MTDLKISGLTATHSLQSADIFPLVRSSANYTISAADATTRLGLGAPTNPTVDLSTFTWLNQDTATAATAATYSTLFTPGNGDSSASSVMAKTTPISGAFTAYLDFIPLVPPVGYGSTGIVLYDSGSGKAITFAFAYRADYFDYKLVVYEYTTTTLFSVASFLNGVLAYPVIRLKLQDDGTNRTYSFSPDGIHYTAAYREANSTLFTGGTAVGVYVDPITTKSYSQIGMIVVGWSLT